MQVKHAKVSGIANPPDPTVVGGGDWDANHTLTGTRILYASEAWFSGGSISSTNGDAGLSWSRNSVGSYTIYLPDDPGVILPIIQAAAALGSFPDYKTRWAYTSSEGSAWLDVWVANLSNVAVDPGMLAVVFVKIG